MGAPGHVGLSHSVAFNPKQAGLIGGTGNGWTIKELPVARAVIPGGRIDLSNGWTQFSFIPSGDGYTGLFGAAVNNTLTHDDVAGVYRHAVRIGAGVRTT